MNGNIKNPNIQGKEIKMVCFLLKDGNTRVRWDIKNGGI